MSLFTSALVAAGIFAAWCFLISIWFRQPFSTSHTVNIALAVTAFFVISIALHLLGITGGDILEFIRVLIVGLFERIDRLIAAGLGLLSITAPFSLAELVDRQWENSVDYLIDAVDLAGGNEAGEGFVANLGLVIFYLIFRSIGTGLISLVIWLGLKTRAFSIDPDDDLDDGTEEEAPDPFEQEGHNWWFDNPAAKRTILIVYRVSIGVLAACVLAALIIAVLTDLSSTTRFPEFEAWVEHMARFAMPLYWAGLIILSGELAAASKVSSWFERWLGGFNFTKNEEEIDNSLEELFETYTNDFGDPNWLSALSFDPEEGVEEEEDHEAEGLVWTKADSEKLLSDFNTDALSQLKQGILTTRDFEMMADLVQITKDRGGTTLIICPQSQNQDDRSQINQYDDISSLVRDNIKDAMGNTVFDVTQTLYMLRDETTTKDLDYSILIGSEFEMADVLSRSVADSAYQAMTKVRSIILVEFQRLDTGVLALQMQRLRRTGLNKRYAVVCQSDARRGLGSTLDNLFQDGSTGAFDSTPVIGRRAHFRYWLLWRFHVGLMEKLGTFTGLTENNRQLPLQESLPLLILPSWLGKCAVSIYDPFGRILLKDWREKWLGRLRSFGKSNMRPAIKWLKAAAPFGLFRTRELCQIIFQEDHANVHEVIQRYHNFEHKDDTMVHVMSSWYPMRDFMYNDLEASKAEKSDILVKEPFLPIQPMPANGPKQVAISIYDALHHADALTGDQIRFLMLDMSKDPAPRLLKEMGATSAKRGIQMLFSRVLGLNQDLNARTPPGTRQTQFSFGAKGLPQDFYLAKVVWKNAETSRTIARVYAGDYGLSYATDTFLPVGRNMFRVIKVESISVPIEADTIISVDQANYSPQGFTARPTVKFCRNYRLINEYDRMAGTLFSEEVKDYPAIVIERGGASYPGPGTAALRLVHLSFERETFGRYMFEHNVPYAQAPKKDCAAVEHPDNPVSGEGFKITRVHQPALVISYVGSAAGRNADRGKIAFTLATTLNDVITTLFPRDAHRLAIISPQASLAHANLRNSADLGRDSSQVLETASYAELAYPKFIAPEPDDMATAPAPDWSRAYGDIFGDGKYRTNEAAHFEEEDRTYTTRRIDLLALEDAGLDLGVARAIHEHWGEIEPHWISYLTWLTKQNGASNPYAFGDNEVPEQFDFEGALTWLS